MSNILCTVNSDDTASIPTGGREYTSLAATTLDIYHQDPSPVDRDLNKVGLSFLH